MKPFRAALFSLPWADYIYPSLPIGAIASYARSQGIRVDAFHVHLETALSLGLSTYTQFINLSGEAISAAALFPERRQTILRLLGHNKSNYLRIIKRFYSILHRIFLQTDWEQYQVIGFTTDLHQLFSSLLFAQWIKQKSPSLKVVFGGRVASEQLGESILKAFSQVDYCMSGEGEQSFVALMRHLKNPSQLKVQDVPGLIYRETNTIRQNSGIQLKTLHGLPDPDFDHYFNLLQHHRNIQSQHFQPYLPIEGGRGCTHKCAFCGARLQMQGYRFRPAHEVAAQMERMAQRYKIALFQFFDLRTNPKTDNTLFDLIARQHHDYNIFYEIRADIQKKLLISMRRSGVDKVQIGIEAVSTELLRKMNKGTSFIQNLQVLKYCEELEIEHHSNLIFGFPTTTAKDIRNSISNIAFAMAYRPPATISSFGLLDSSLVFQHPAHYGISSIQNDHFLATLLPPRLRGKLQFLLKTYRLKRPAPDYSPLRAALKQWQQRYAQIKRQGTKLLSYRDLGNDLLIEDYRHHATTYTLDGMVRELYLFCDSIKTYASIRERFSEYQERDIKMVMNKLIKLRLMFREKNSYLSLAIRANNMQPFEPPTAT